ncbi:dipeptidase [Hyalangium minutum]|uniref:Renal dipeptidase family protein n=1 Tax=Hyalangium minutum TaxID=394096 RepID=A0A085WQM3_9BACT|nr:dipeptidase [Hyalangium minutum]KFE69986.1 Renal dipeptidase family protein [Hyalangium minutum]
MRKWIVLGIVAVLVVGTFIGLDVAATRAGRRMNGVHPGPPYTPTKRGAALHSQLFITDLHADPLLWNRDLNERSKDGQVDVPRLLEGNVSLQIFSVVTKTPKHMNTERNDDTTDDVQLLAFAQRWPPSAWFSLKARALYQARKLEDLAEDSDGKLVFMRTRAELEQFLIERQKDRNKVGALLSLEGMHALEGKVEAVDDLYAAGFRMLGFAHFFDNEVSGSAHGMKKEGLTELGRAVVKRMEERGMTLDLAHSSRKTFEDVLAIATRPVVVSHSGVRGTCDNNRNLSDSQLRAIARNGGVVGIGYWSTATCGKDAKAIARAIRYAVSVAGLEHVGLGSDFDGAVTTPFDTAGLVEVTDALIAEGFGEGEIRKIAGENVLRVLRANLPAQ